MLQRRYRRDERLAPVELDREPHERPLPDGLDDDTVASVVPRGRDAHRLGTDHGSVPHVGEAEDPALGAGHARQLAWIVEDFARFLARDQVRLTRHAPRHADPLPVGRSLLARHGRRRATAAVQRNEQVEGLVLQ